MRRASRAVDRDGHPRPAGGGLCRPNVFLADGQVLGELTLADGRPGSDADDELGARDDKDTVRGLLARKLRLALTALAVVLGVTFVTGTLVLTDTLNRTFDTLIGTAYQHINFQIRGTAASTTTPRPPRTDRRPQTDPGVARRGGPPPAGRRLRRRSVAGYHSSCPAGMRSAEPARHRGSRLTPTTAVLGAARPGQSSQRRR